MSDITRLDKFTSARQPKDRKPAYSDFFTNFNKHPDTGALVRLTEADSVKRALRNLLLTNRGERVYRPDLGSDIRRVLFEPMTEQMADQLKTYIEDAIGKHEPRVKVVRVLVVPYETQNAYSVNILYEIINSNELQNLNLNLVRVR